MGIAQSANYNERIIDKAIYEISCFQGNSVSLSKYYIYVIYVYICFFFYYT